MKDKKLILRIGITASAVCLLTIKLLFPNLHWDITALVIFAIAILPWLTSIIETAKLPGGLEFKFREVEKEQAIQRTQIDRVQKFLLDNFVNDEELKHLRSLESNRPFLFEYRDSFASELRRLAGLRLINRKPNKGIRSLRNDIGGDVKTHFEISTRGQEYLKHLKSGG